MTFHSTEAALPVISELRDFSNSLSSLMALAKSGNGTTPSSFNVTTSFFVDKSHLLMTHIAAYIHHTVWFNRQFDLLLNSSSADAATTRVKSAL